MSNTTVGTTGKHYENELFVLDLKLFLKKICSVKSGKNTR